MIIVKTREVKGFQVVEFELQKPIAPEELPTVIEEITKCVKHGKPLLLSGRGPIYLYAAITHEVAHVTPVLGVYDPKLSGYVIVSSHRKEFKIGDIIKIE